MLFFSFKIHLQSIDLRFLLIELMLHVSDSLVKLSLLTFMSKHKCCLFVLCFLGTLLDLSFTLVEIFSLLLKFCLEIEYLLVSISLDCV